MTAYADASLVALAAALRAPGGYRGSIERADQGPARCQSLPSRRLSPVGQGRGPSLHSTMQQQIYLFCTAQRDSTAHGAQSTA